MSSSLDVIKNEQFDEVNRDSSKRIAHFLAKIWKIVVEMEIVDRFLAHKLLRKSGYRLYPLLFLCTYMSFSTTMEKTRYDKERLYRNNKNSFWRNHAAPSFTPVLSFERNVWWRSNTLLGKYRHRFSRRDTRA